MTTHLVIPDTQAKPGAPTDHLRWIGHYIVDKKPDVIIHLGDHWDMPSLSSYDRGKKAMEGRRYRQDVDAGNEAWAVLNKPLDDYNRQRAKTKHKQYTPVKKRLLGNHEQRIDRATEMDAALDGTIGYDDLLSPGWEVHDFLDMVEVDGVLYSHYFYNPNSGRPYTSMIENRIRTVGQSFTMGHQQTLAYGLVFTNNGQQRHGLVAGACYLHDEDYKGYQGNAHWRGIIRKSAVKDGSYDPTFISLDSLCQRYEGVTLSHFMAKKYPELEVSY